MVTVAQYDCYKESHSPWLGKVPEHWELLPGLAVLKENKEKNTGMIEDTVLSLSYGKVVVRPPEKLTGLVPESFETYQIINPGDIIIRPTDLQNDTTSLRTGLAKDRGIITSAYLCLHPAGNVKPAYLHYLLHAFDLIKVFYGLGSGLRQNLDYQDFKRLELVVPPPEEQDRIVNFLDQKTAEIDEAIAKKQRLIELLKEQKAILINQAVTKGLNPDAPMRDSGVEWVGRIPSHWELRKVKHVALMSPSKSLDGVKRNKNIVTFLPMEKIHEDGSIDCSEKRSVREVIDGFTYFQKNDIVIAKITPCFENGKGSHLTELDTDYGFGTTELHVVRPKSIYGGFLFWLLNRTEFLIHGEEFMIGSAGQKRVPKSFIANYLFAMPPENEQKEIVVYIDDLISDFNAALNSENNSIQLLEEYKKTLVSETVTGKIKV